MTLIEIVTIIACVAIVGGVVGTYIYKKMKHLPTGECASCAGKPNSLVDQYHKMYGCKDGSCCRQKDTR